MHDLLSLVLAAFIRSLIVEDLLARLNPGDISCEQRAVQSGCSGSDKDQAGQCVFFPGRPFIAYGCDQAADHDRNSSKRCCPTDIASVGWALCLHKGLRTTQP